MAPGVAPPQPALSWAQSQGACARQHRRDTGPGVVISPSESGCELPGDGGAAALCFLAPLPSPSSGKPFRNVDSPAWLKTRAELDAGPFSHLYSTWPQLELFPMSAKGICAAQPPGSGCTHTMAGPPERVAALCGQDPEPAQAPRVRPGSGRPLEALHPPVTASSSPGLRPEPTWRPSPGAAISWRACKWQTPTSGAFL